MLGILLIGTFGGGLILGLLIGYLLAYPGAPGPIDDRRTGEGE